MCEANVYIVRESGAEELLLEDVEILRPAEGGLYLKTIYGRQLTVPARIREMNLVEHRVVLEEAPGTD